LEVAEVLVEFGAGGDVEEEVQSPLLARSTAGVLDSKRICKTGGQLQDPDAPTNIMPTQYNFFGPGHYNQWIQYLLYG